MNNDQYISKNNLFNLFTKTNLLETSSVPNVNLKTRSNKTVVINKLSANTLTPMSKLIYDSSDDKDKEQLLIDLAKDNEYINQLNDNDPDYLEKLANNRLGFYMEDFVCHHIKCPNCEQKTLRRYIINNMPVVDVICTNTNHHNNFNDVYMFQIKITVDDNTYFNKKGRYILVGSKKFGYNSHEIYGSDDIQTKKLLVGYICLQLNTIRDSEYKINKTNSFIITPNTNKLNNVKYYQYSDKIGMFSHSIINWNNDMIIEHNLNNLCDQWSVNTNDVYYNEKIIDNPYNTAGKFSNKSNIGTKRKLQFAGYKYKYLKYKNKYLELKKLN